MKTADIQHTVRLALMEDVGQGDITTNALIPAGLKAKARLIFKSPGIACGLDVAAQAFKLCGPYVKFTPSVKEGALVAKGTVVAYVQGPARTLLTAERVALNFLGRLSGIATQTRAFVDAVKPHRSIILDTRKTTPLLRAFERYAVCCGGGSNHRFDLHAMTLIKDNHRHLCGGILGIKDAVAKARQRNKKVEVETDTLAQVREALASSADIILLDNMSVSQVRQAVGLRHKAGSRILLEASGGITLKNVRAYAATGVDCISIGALTHSPKALDVSLEFIS